MKLRNDLKTGISPEAIEVVQLTEEEVPSSHVYMEAQIFTPDSKKLVIHRSAHAHGSDVKDPAHGYLLCDIENGCELSPLTDETGAKAPSVSPNGEYLYYFVDETGVKAGRLTLKRVGIDGSGREEICAVEGRIPGHGGVISSVYPLSTVSSDGTKIAASCFLGDGETEDAPYGLLVFDVRKGELTVPLEGPSFCNMHPQYSRSREPGESSDILVQENHGNIHDAGGKVERLSGGSGADIHVIRDDGSNFRDMPWGRTEEEKCQGHQCWRGRSGLAITSTGSIVCGRREAQLIQARAAEHKGHIGKNTPNACRNDLTREISRPNFHHFATDISGGIIITDGSCGAEEKTASAKRNIYIGKLPPDEDGAIRGLKFLLDTGSSCCKQAHVHPFLSPDGTAGFFNSDESGLLQAYMIRGLGRVY